MARSLWTGIGRQAATRGTGIGALRILAVLAVFLTPLIVAPAARAAEAGDVPSRVLNAYVSSVLSVAVSPDGRTIAAASEDNAIRLWDIATGNHLRGLTGHTGWVHSVQFSPDGRILASGSEDATIRLWDVATGKELRSLRGHMDWGSSVQFSPDGHTLASGSTDKTIRLWDVATGKGLRSLKGHEGWVNSVQFSPDGRMLASGGADKTIRLWDVPTGRQLHSLVGHTDTVASVQFSPDGRTLVSGSGDNTIRLWDVATGKEPRSLARHTEPVISVQFSPDGRILASGSGDKTIRLWEAATGKELRSLTGHMGWVRSVQFSPDGRTLASGSDDKTIRLWDLTGIMAAPVAAAPQPAPAPLIAAPAPAVAAIPAKPTAQPSERRVALLIGNARYAAMSRLDNTVNDVAEVGRSLTAAGFDVDTVIDADGNRWIDALNAFGQKANTADIAVFYYSGHAIELGAVNYLLPVDTRLDSELRLKKDGQTLEDVLAAMKGARKLRLALLDSCRDNPFIAAVPGVTKGAIRPGLAAVPLTDQAPVPTVIAFATAPGRVANAGTDGGSPFAHAIARQMFVPGRLLETALRNVANDVHDQTAGAQDPYISNTRFGEIYLGGAK